MNTGISFGYGSQRSGLSFFVDANKSLGKENGDSDSYTETNLTAGKTLTLQSGRDTTLTGALVTGDKVVVDVGRDFTLTSQQDQNHYDSKQTSASASASFSYGSGGGGSLSLSQQTVKSNFLSVLEQTGLYAGKQGFDVTVGGHTQLNGAVLASTAEAGANHLTTGTLGWSDLHNAAEYQVKSQGVSLSSNMASGSPTSPSSMMAMGSLGANALLNGGKRSGSSDSTTQAAMSAGSIDIRDTAAQQQDVASLNRDVEHAANGLSVIFDKQKELDKLQEAQLIGEIGQQATQIVVTDKLGQAQKRADKDPAYARSDEYKALQAQWGMGSDFQQGVQAATAALQGLSGGDLTAALSGVAAPYLATQIKNLTTDPNDPTKVTGANVLAHALLGAALAQAKDGDAAAGAIGAGSAPLIARYLSEALYHETDASKLSETQKQNIAALTTVAGALAGGLARGDTASALDAGQTAKNEVENNFLGPKSLERLEQERAALASKQFSTDTALGLVHDDQSNQNSDVLLNRYRQDPNSLSPTEKAQLFGDLQQYYQENAQVYGSVVAERLVQSLLRDGPTFQDYGFAYAADGNTREAQSLANGWGLFNTREQSANEQYYLDAQSHIASVGYQKSQAAVTNEALFFVPGVNLFMSVALASAGGERVGSGVAQAWDGDYAGAAGNLGMGALQVVGGRYGLSLGGEAAGELSATSTKFGANSWRAENNGAFSIQNSGWSSEVGYSGGAFNAEGLTGRLGSGVANSGARQFSGSAPALEGDFFSADVVNARSADFYRMYGDNPLRGTMSNVEARQWYLAEDAQILNRIDSSASLEGLARQAFDLRNVNRTQAREFMSDRVTADRLIREEPNMTWDQMLEYQWRNKGLTGNDAYRSILQSSQKTRVSVNKQLGVE